MGIKSTLNSGALGVPQTFVPQTLGTPPVNAGGIGFTNPAATGPLLMILAKDDAVAPPDSIREAFNRAGDPKRLLEVAGGHYAVYSGNGANKAGQAATEWFTEHLLHAKPAATPLALA